GVSALAALLAAHGVPAPRESAIDRRRGFWRRPGAGHGQAPYLTGRARLQPRAPAAVVLVVLVGSLAGVFVQVARAPLGIDYAALRDAAPDKTIVPILRDPTQHARIVDTRWDAFARTDVVATDDPS